MKCVLILLASCMFVTALSSQPPLAPPNGLTPDEIPQFVTLTFDDAINILNYPRTYEKLFKRLNKHNGCPIQATFFVCHENTNYHLVNELYIRGHEIAVHSISHKSDTHYWAKPDKQRWHDEIVGMQQLLSQFAQIPINEINGHRAPFLQTAGNVTFRVLNDAGFLYDSSMPTLTYSKPNPAFPYKLDRKYSQDCQIQPCPNEAFGNIWLAPMVDYWRMREVIKDQPWKPSPCSMADFCLPYPETAADTFDYLLENFNRHYRTNKAPFPIFIHESWLMHNERHLGFLQFIDYLLLHEDVYLVSMQEMIKWMANPVPITEYKQTKCIKNAPHSKCQSGTTCPYTKVKEFEGNDKSFVICGDTCPTMYPWVGNPLGHG